MPRQIAYFDVVRGLSAQFVVLGHALNLLLAGTLTTLGPDGIYGARPGTFYIASFGVVVFFVLSGYLITASVTAKWSDPAYGTRRYLTERAVRIFLPFLPATVLIFVMDRLVFADGGTAFTEVDTRWSTLLASLAMLQGNPGLQAVEQVSGVDVARDPVGTADPFWTVAIEWWIYVVFGLLVLVLLRRLRHRTLVGTLLVSAIALGSLAVPSGGLILAWLIGMLYAWQGTALRALPVLVHRVVTAGAAVGAVAALSMTGNSIYHPAVAAATAVTLLSGYHALPRRDGSAATATRGGRISAFLSEFSYSLYLIHFPVMIYLTEAFPGMKTWPGLLVLFVVSNVVGVGFWWLFERHHRRVRTFLLRRHPARPASSDDRTPPAQAGLVPAPRAGAKIAA